MRVKTTDTAREPRQPRRLEKKKNIWSGSFGMASLTGLDGAGRDSLPDHRDRRWHFPRPANRNPSGPYLAGQPVTAVTLLAPARRPGPAP